jgi:hypothetical protein
MSGGQTHEVVSITRAVKMGSDRGFALVFAIVFGVIAIAPAITLGWHPKFDPALVRVWSMAIAVIFLAVGLICPPLMRPLNRLWFYFGVLLSKFTTPAVMGLLFVAVVVPTAVIMRLLRHDLLRLAFDRQATSYWIERRPPGPARDTMKNQY